MEMILALGAGFLLIGSLISLGIWVFISITHMKALRMLGYATPWFAWIPFLNYVAFADSIQEGETITILGQEIPFKFFRFWWVLCLVAPFIPVVGTILGYVIQVLCLGTNYIKMFAKLENRTEEDVQVVGYVSGLLPIVAAVKLMLVKENN